MAAAFYSPKGNLKRGQLKTSIPEIQEACSWNVGYRKEVPSKSKIFRIIEWLRRTGEQNGERNTNGTMIETTKATQGIVITITNYSHYQDPENYERNAERNDEETANGTRTERHRNNKKKNVKKENKEKNYKEKRYIPFPEIIDHLNLRIGTSYKSTSKKTQSLISARWKEGFKIEDFKAVVDKKCVEWAGTDMEKYLRPETLFGTKFEGYLNQPTAKKRNKQQEQDDLFREIYEEAEG